MIKYVMTPDLATEFNRSGTHGKHKLEDKKLYLIIKGMWLNLFITGDLFLDFLDPPTGTMKSPPVSHAVSQCVNPQQKVSYFPSFVSSGYLQQVSLLQVEKWRSPICEKTLVFLRFQATENILAVFDPPGGE